MTRIPAVRVTAGLEGSAVGQHFCVSLGHAGQVVCREDSAQQPEVD